MFSNINYILHHLYLCENFGCIPVIDFENYPTKYNEPDKINSSLNMWDYYFEPINQYKLDEIYKSKFVIITSNKTNKIKEFDTFRISQLNIMIYSLNILRSKRIFLDDIKNFEEKYFLNKKSSWSTF